MTNFIYGQKKEEKETQRVEVNPKHEELLNKFIELCSKNIPEDFIIQRKYEEDIVKKLKIGLCTKEVYEQLREIYDLKILKEAGFITDRMTKLYCDRIIFPFNSYYFSARSQDTTINPLYKNLFPKKEVAGSKQPYYIKNDSDEIILCEGETDAISLNHVMPSCDILAVGGVQSAKGFIKNIKKNIKKIYLCFDNDPEGEKATEKISDILYNKGFDIKIIKFDDKYKDFDDLYRDKKLDSLSHVSFEPHKKIKEMEEMQGFSAEWLLNANIPPTQWLIDNFLVEGGITVFGGDSGAGKSLLALYISMCVTNGKTIFDSFQNKQGEILYLDEENIKPTLKTRIMALSKTCEITENLDKLNFYVMENIKLDSMQGKNKEGLLKFNYLMEKHKPQICVIDSLVRFFCGDENSSNDVKEIFETLKLSSKKYGTSFILLHHTTKVFNGGSRKHTLRGSGDISAMADIVFVLNKVSNTNFVSIYQEKNRHEEPLQPFNMIINEVHGDLCVSYGGELQNTKNNTVTDNAVNEIVDMIKKNDWIELYSNIGKSVFLRKGFTDRQWYSAIKSMTDQGWLSKIENKKGTYKVNDKFREICVYDLYTVVDNFSHIFWGIKSPQKAIFGDTT